MVRDIALPGSSAETITPNQELAKSVDKVIKGLSPEVLTKEIFDGTVKLAEKKTDTINQAETKGGFAITFLVMAGVATLLSFLVPAAEGSGTFDLTVLGGGLFIGLLTSVLYSGKIK